MPSDSLQSERWNSYWQNAGSESDPSFPQYRRFAYAIDNNRATAKYKYYRPIVEDGITPPEDQVSRNGCWYYMRGPTPLDVQDGGNSNSSSLTISGVMLNNDVSGKVLLRVDAPGSNRLQVLDASSGDALIRQFSSNEMYVGFVSFEHIFNRRPGTSSGYAIEPRQIKARSWDSSGTMSESTTTVFVGYR